MMGLRIATCLFAMLFSACTRQDAVWMGTVEEIDGVQFVRNPMEPMYKNVLELDLNLSLGDVSGRDDATNFPRIGAVLVDDAENILVFIPRANQVRIFDRNGSYLRSFGRKGQGPGESVRPSSVQMSSQNEIFLDDMRRLIYYSTEGVLIRETLVTGLPLGFRQMKIDRQGNFWGVFGIREPRFTICLRKYDAEQEKLFTIASVPPTSPPYIFDLNERDELVWAVPLTYEIRVSGPDGEHLKTITREHVPVKTTAEFRKAFIKRTGGSADMPEYLNVVEDISIDETGKIFVRTNELNPSDGSPFHDVFDQEGRYLTRIGIAAMLKKPLVWKHKQLYTIEEDEDGYQYVKRYHVIWKI